MTETRGLERHLRLLRGSCPRRGVQRGAKGGLREGTEMQPRGWQRDIFVHSHGMRVLDIWTRPASARRRGAMANTDLAAVQPGGGPGRIWC